MRLSLEAVSLRRHLDLNAVGLPGIASDKGEGRIAAPEFAVHGVDHAGARAMNCMKFDLVQTLLQNPSPEVVAPIAIPQGASIRRTMLRAQITPLSI